MLHGLNVKVMVIQHSQKAYGFEFKNIRTMQIGLVYDALKNKASMQHLVIRQMEELQHMI